MAEAPTPTRYDTFKKEGLGEVRKELLNDNKGYKPNQLDKADDTTKALASISTLKKLQYSPAQQNVIFKEILGDEKFTPDGIEDVMKDKENSAGNTTIVDKIKKWQTAQNIELKKARKPLLKVDGVLGPKSLEHADSTYDFDGIAKTETASNKKLKNKSDTLAILQTSIGINDTHGEKQDPDGGYITFDEKIKQWIGANNDQNVGKILNLKDGTYSDKTQGGG